MAEAPFQKNVYPNLNIDSMFCLGSIYLDIYAINLVMYSRNTVVNTLKHLRSSFVQNVIWMEYLLYF